MLIIAHTAGKFYLCFTKQLIMLTLMFYCMVHSILFYLMYNHSILQLLALLQFFRDVNQSVIAAASLPMIYNELKSQHGIILCCITNNILKSLSVPNIFSKSLIIFSADDEAPIPERTILPVRDFPKAITL